MATAIAGLARALAPMLARSGGKGGGGGATVGKIAEVGFAVQGMEAAQGAVVKLGTAAIESLSPITSLNVAFGTMSKMANFAVGHVTALGNTVGQFVQFANPAHVKFFEMASRDLMASFGRGLIPVMQFATAITRGFADVIFRLSGPFQNLMRVFDPFTALIPKLVGNLTPLLNIINKFVEDGAETAKPFMELGAAFLEMAGTLFELFTEIVSVSGVLDLFLNPLRQFGFVIKWVAQQIQIGSDQIKRMFGLGRDTAAGSSYGAAATNVKTSSVEDFYKDAMKSAFALGSGMSAPERTAAATTSILDLLNGWLPNISIEALAIALAKLIPKLPGEETIGSLASDLGISGRDTGRAAESAGGGRSWFDRAADPFDISGRVGRAIRGGR